VGVALEKYVGTSLIVPVGARLQWSGNKDRATMWGLKGYLDGGLRIVALRSEQERNLHDRIFVPGVFLETAIGGVESGLSLGCRGEFTGVRPASSSTPDLRVFLFLNLGNVRGTAGAGRY
jgi:hypothetical protein